MKIDNQPWTIATTNRITKSGILAAILHQVLCTSSNAQRVNSLQHRWGLCGAFYTVLWLLITWPIPSGISMYDEILCSIIEVHCKISLCIFVTHTNHGDIRHLHIFAIPLSDTLSPTPRRHPQKIGWTPSEIKAKKPPCSTPLLLKTKIYWKNYLLTKNYLIKTKIRIKEINGW